MSSYECEILNENIYLQWITCILHCASQRVDSLLCFRNCMFSSLMHGVPKWITYSSFTWFINSNLNNVHSTIAVVTELEKNKKIIPDNMSFGTFLNYRSITTSLQNLSVYMNIDSQIYRRMDKSSFIKRLLFKWLSFVKLFNTILVNFHLVH